MSLVSVHPAPPLRPSRISSDTSLHVGPVLHAVVPGLHGVGATVLPIQLSPPIAKWPPTKPEHQHSCRSCSLTTPILWGSPIADGEGACEPSKFFWSYHCRCSQPSLLQLFGHLPVSAWIPACTRLRCHCTPLHDGWDEEGTNAHSMTTETKKAQCLRFWPKIRNLHWSAWWAMKRFRWLLRSISRIVSVCSPQLIAFKTIFNREH